MKWAPGLGEERDKRQRLASLKLIAPTSQTGPCLLRIFKKKILTRL